MYLERTQDILKEIGLRKKDQILVGFAAETENLEQHAETKLVEKNLDIIVGNIVGESSSGFGADTNKVTLFFKEGTQEPLPVMEKDAVAHILLDRILKIAGERYPLDADDYILQEEYIPRFNRDVVSAD